MAGVLAVVVPVAVVGVSGPRTRGTEGIDRVF